LPSDVMRMTSCASIDADAAAGRMLSNVMVSQFVPVSLEKAAEVARMAHAATASNTAQSRGHGGGQRQTGRPPARGAVVAKKAGRTLSGASLTSAGALQAASSSIELRTRGKNANTA
jgi:hypothetical protein